MTASLHDYSSEDSDAHDQGPSQVVFVFTLPIA
jgi:hypothetical protein